jgi:nucleotide-binding universal stress UspA family protein
MAAQPRRIVVGFDGTEGARRALDAAAEMAGYGTSLSVVAVVRDGDRSGKDVLAVARELLLDRLVTADYVKRTGDPATEIVAAASELAADLVVVGRRDGPENLHGEPGSVSAEVVRRAACDVLVAG